MEGRRSEASEIGGKKMSSGSSIAGKKKRVTPRLRPTESRMGEVGEVGSRSLSEKETTAMARCKFAGRETCAISRSADGQIGDKKEKKRDLIPKGGSHAQRC